MSIRRRRGRAEEEAMAEQIFDAIISGVMLGQITVQAMEDRLLVDARRLGRLIVDGAPAEQYQIQAMELDFAAKLLVLADDRQTTVDPGQQETS